MKINELKIINEYLVDLTFNNKSSLKLKDDVFYDTKKKIIFSTDTYEEGIHFLNSSNPKRFLKKIFRSSISDIYCKGSLPTTYFLSLSIKKINNNWLRTLKSELNKESKKYGLFLGGGDTIKSKKLSISISVLGHAGKKPVLRKGAKFDDDIYVTGNLGESYLGLLFNLKKIYSKKFINYFIKSYEQPKLPVKFSSYLHKFASSSIDISDGFLKDLKSICSAGNFGAEISFSALPFSSKTKNLCRIKKIKLIDVFSRGDDYQILFTAKRNHRKQIDSISIKTSTKVSRVGRITRNHEVKLNNGGKNVNISNVKTGFIHTF